MGKRGCVVSVSIGAWIVLILLVGGTEMSFLIMLPVFVLMVPAMTGDLWKWLDVRMSLPKDTMLDNLYDDDLKR